MKQKKLIIQNNSHDRHTEDDRGRSEKIIASANWLPPEANYFGRTDHIKIGANNIIEMISQLQHANRWRKVSEELPKIDRILIKVMCHFPNGNHDVRYTTDLIYSKDNCSLDDECIEEISRSYKAIEWKPIE